MSATNSHKTIRFAEHRNAIWGGSIGVLLGHPVLPEAREDGRILEMLEDWEFGGAPRAFIAEQQLDQVFYFFGGIMAHIDKHPDAGCHAAADLVPLMTPDVAQIAAVQEALAELPAAVKPFLGPFGAYLVPSCLG